MVQISLVIACALFVGAWLKNQAWFPTKFIPATIVLLAVIFNIVNALLFDGDILDAIRLAVTEAIAAVGIHSTIKNTVEGANQNDQKNL